MGRAPIRAGIVQGALVSLPATSAGRDVRLLLQEAGEDEAGPMDSQDLEEVRP